MARVSGWIVMVPLVASLAACGDTGTVVDDVGTLWGEESTAEREEREKLAARQANKVPMMTIRALEVGRTSNGILLTAFGTAPGPGYSVPGLRVRRSGQLSADGYVEFDFVAAEPAPGLEQPPANERNIQVRADLPIDLGDLRGAAGVRVFALRGQAQVNF